MTSNSMPRIRQDIGSLISLTRIYSEDTGMSFRLKCRHMVAKREKMISIRDWSCQRAPLQTYRTTTRTLVFHRPVEFRMRFQGLIFGHSQMSAGA